jgi:hypothetical protein
MMATRDDRDDALEAWAASDEVSIGRDDPKLLRGEAARQYGQEILAVVGRGRRPLDETMVKGEHSPRRQVRLPQALSDNLDHLASKQGRQPSALMRDAISEYLTRHSQSA